MDCSCNSQPSAVIQHYIWNISVHWTKMEAAGSSGGLTAAASHCSLAQIAAWLTSKGWWLFRSVLFAPGNRGATFHRAQWEWRLPLYMERRPSTADYTAQPCTNSGFQNECFESCSNIMRTDFFCSFLQKKKLFMMNFNKAHTKWSHNIGPKHSIHRSKCFQHLLVPSCWMWDFAVCHLWW